MSVRLLEELVEIAGRDVLDIGCGEGAVARRLAAAGARVVGIDPLPGALAMAIAAGPDGDWPVYVEGIAEELPFADASFDVAVFFNSLHHVSVDGMEAALSEAARVLRPGCTLYVQEPLARGSAFELLRPVNDETSARAAALRALEAAAAGPFVRVESREALMTVRHEDIAGLRARVVSVDPDRETRFDAHEAQIEAAFSSLGRPVEAGGYEFEQPLRIELLRKR